MKNRARIIVPIAILLTGLVAIQILVALRPKVEAKPAAIVTPRVRVVVAEPQDVEMQVHTQGTVVPRTESDLIPQVSGAVVWVSPSLVSGGFFAKGDPLVRIDRGDYEVELQTARAAVARAESEQQRAATELARQRRLQELGVTAQARFEDAANANAVTDAGLREAHARLTRAQRDLARTELSAPFDGRVRNRDVDVGQFVNRGASIATLYAVDSAEVRLPLPDRDLRWVDLPLDLGAGEAAVAGPIVTLRADFAGSERTWTGRVVRTEGEIDPRSRMVHVVATVDDPYGRQREEAGAPLAVGLFVEAEIAGRVVPGAFVLPRAALHADAAGEGDRVHVVDAEDRLYVRRVEVLRSDRDTVVIGAGLAAGERVSISPLAAVVDGMPVRIIDEADPATSPAAVPVAGPDGAETSS